LTLIVIRDRPKAAFKYQLIILPKRCFVNQSQLRQCNKTSRVCVLFMFTVCY